MITITIDNGKVTVQIDDNGAGLVTDGIDKLKPRPPQIVPPKLHPRGSVSEEAGDVLVGKDKSGNLATKTLTHKFKPCVMCGNPVPYKTSPRKYCDDCKSKREEARTTIAVEPQVLAPKTTIRPTKKCVHVSCNRTFTPTNNVQKYCPAHSKKLSQRVVETEPWKPKQTIPTPVLHLPNSSSKPQDQSLFADPWNCAACRNIGKLCYFHLRMDAKGTSSPKTVGSGS